VTQAYEITAFWDARPRSIEEYAEDLMQLIRALGATDPRLARWYISDDPSPSAVVAVEEIRAALSRQVETWEHGGTTYRANLVRLTNAAPEGGRVTIDAMVGIDRPSGTVWFPNRVGMRFWGPGALDAFEDNDIVVRWLEIAVVVFDPDWASVSPDGQLKTRWEDLLDGRPAVSWMVYLSPQYGSLPQVPPPSKAYQLRQGSVVVTVPGWFDPIRPQDRAAADAARAALDLQGKRPRRVTLIPD
jgi:hypothetical protein